jgi:hypothetical protein
MNGGDIFGGIDYFNSSAQFQTQLSRRGYWLAASQYKAGAIGPQKSSQCLRAHWNQVRYVAKGMDSRLIFLHPFFNCESTTRI